MANKKVTPEQEPKHIENAIDLIDELRDDLNALGLTEMIATINLYQKELEIDLQETEHAMNERKDFDNDPYGYHGVSYSDFL